MAETTVIRLTNVSGTSFTVNVSGLALAPELTTKDFLVTHNGVDVTPLYTKTSATLISYAGSNVVLGTRVEVRRNTSLSFAETSFLSTTTALELTNAMSKLKRRVDELEALTTWQTALINQAGLTLGSIPILDNAYGVGWDADTSNAPSRNALYDRFEAVNLARTKLVLVASRLSSVSLAFSTFVDRSLTADYTGAGVTWTGGNTLTISETGYYLAGYVGRLVIGGTTPPTSLDYVASVKINGSNDALRLARIPGRTHEVLSAVDYHVSGWNLSALAAGDTLRAQIYVSVFGGSGVTATLDNERFMLVKISQ